MKIEAVDFFYLSIPRVLDIGDGSQDALLVRVQAGPYVGWGECEAAPSALGREFTTTQIVPDANGCIHIPTRQAWAPNPICPPYANTCILLRFASIGKFSFAASDSNE